MSPSPPTPAPPPAIEPPHDADPDDADPAGPGPIVLIHGFTQTARCWAPIDTALAPHGVVALDAPGHGTAGDERLDLVDGADALARRGGRGTYLGYSMGGRFALHVALARPDLVTRLVLVSATAGITDADERSARHRSDQALADHLLAVGVPAFLDEWLALPLFAGLPPARAHRAERLVNTAEGLASSLRLAGTGTQVPLWERLAELTMPVLVVAGADDPKFVALARQLVDAIGADADLAVIDGAGHTVHLEQPEAFLALVEPWLAATDPGARR